MESTPGKRMQAWREFKGLSLTDVFKLTGVKVTTLSTAESATGSNPSYDTITKLLQAFPDLNPDWLLLGTGPMLRGEQNLTRVAERGPLAAIADQFHRNGISVPGVTPIQQLQAESETLLKLAVAEAKLTEKDQQLADKDRQLEAKEKLIDKLWTLVPAAVGKLLSKLEAAYDGQHGLAVPVGS